MPVFEHDSIRFYYTDEGNGIPLVFEHGLGRDQTHAAELIQPEEGIRIISLDCRGHGQTVPVGDPGKISFSDFADDVAALMDRLGIRAFAAGGISMGAGIAMNLAIRYPERISGLVLVRPAWLDQPNPDNLKHFAIIARYLRDFGAEQGLREFRLSPEYVLLQKEKPQVLVMMENEFMQAGAAERVVRYEKLPWDVPNSNPQEWEKISAATLVIGCKEDYVHPYAFARRLSQAIPKAILVEVPAKTVDAGIYVSMSRDAIIRFLKRNYSS